MIRYLLKIKNLKKPTLYRTDTHIAHIREYPLPAAPFRGK